MTAAVNACRVPRVSGVADTAAAGEEVDVAAWVARLAERTGLRLSAGRRSFFMNGVGRRLREIGCHGYDDYFRYLDSGRGGNLEWAALAAHLTVRETRFFRDRPALDFLEREFLPRAAERVACGRPVQVWSAGCSTGEETYTLAMLLDRYLRGCGLRPDYGVIGSDLSWEALTAARRGTYGERRRQSPPQPYRREYTLRTESGLEVVRSLCRRVCFTRIDLLEDDFPALPGMDAIYCQNVLIYFDRARRERILEHLVARLRPGGFLVLGPGEALGWRHADLVRTGGQDLLAFRRRGG